MSLASILNLQPDTTFTVGTSRLPVTPSYIGWGDPVTDPASALGSLLFDAIYSEEHNQSSMVTDHPVEQGTNITDNVRPLPAKVTLEVFVSNTPVNSPHAVRTSLPLAPLPQPGQGGFLVGGTSAVIGAAAQGILSAIGFGKVVNTTALTDQFYGETDFAKQAYDTLLQLQAQAVLLTVYTPKEEYTNMLLESVKMHRNPGVGTGANFTLEFREIVIVSSSIVAAPLPTIPRGNGTAATGTQQEVKPSAGQKVSLKKAQQNSSGSSVPGSGVVQ